MLLALPSTGLSSSVRLPGIPCISMIIGKPKKLKINLLLKISKMPAEIQKTEDILKTFKNNLTALYGEGGSGKTTLCLMATAEKIVNSQKVIYLDAESNFSAERFAQLLENKEKINNVLVLKLKNFNFQHEQIKKLENIKNISLIIVDSITHFYRRLYRRKPEIARAMLGKQLSILRKISKSIPVIITGQVYSDMNKKILPLGNTIIKKFSDTLIELEKEPKRKLIIKKPEKKAFYFEIVNAGIKII